MHIMTVFLGVYKAVYAYEPQTEEELAIDENDLLYLLEKSAVDDWWTVKKRVIGSDQDEPVGLVPKTYIEDAPVLRSVVAAYDYEQVQNANEELSFQEGDAFDLYDDRDADWFLVKSVKTGEVGFVPGNYMENAPAGGAPAGAMPAMPATPAMVPLADLQPPPQRIDRMKQLEEDRSSPVSAAAAAAAPAVSNGGMVEVSALPPPPQRMEIEPATPTSEAQPVDIYTQPPSMPQRPSNTDHQVEYPAENGRARSSSHYDRNSRAQPDSEEEQDYSQPAQPARTTRNERTWSLSEIDGRKKRKATLTIGPSRVLFNSSKTKIDQEWAMKDLINYNNEKKHLFLEFKNPYINLELHTGSTDVAHEIVAILGEIKGAEAASGLREVEAASKSHPKKRAKVIFDFFAESPDELTVREGDYVNILDDTTSKDWFMCESVETGKKGVIPAQFIETHTAKPSAANSLLTAMKKMGDSTKSKSKTRSRSNTSQSAVAGNWKQDAEQDLSKKKSKTSKFFSKKSKPEANDKEFPDSKKVRIWVDKSGSFKVEAQFLGCVDGKVHLHKVNGVKIAVAADKLSDDDILYVERLTGMSMEKYKPKHKHSTSDSSAIAQERERRKKAKERDQREREIEERERDRKLREVELAELKKTRDLLETEREKLKHAQDKELPPVKPPRPTESNHISSSKPSRQSDYDWFEFFLNCGVDVNNCQRYAMNFEREQIDEEILPQVEPSLLRTLGLREGDILRVMKFLDTKYGRVKDGSSNSGMFTEADGSLKFNHTGSANSAGVSHKLLPESSNGIKDDDAWTVRPAAAAQETSSKTQDFSGSLQDLLDLQPLEPKKKETPQPNLNDLVPVKSGSSTKTENEPLSATKTGASLIPLDPFKTGGNNIIPMATGGFIMMPVATGGLLPLQATGGYMPLQRTGGFIVPQTTFGMQPSGSVLPVQKTANGLIPVNTGSALMPQTTFGMQQASLLPQNTFGATSVTGGLMPLQRTGGAIPQTSFSNNFTGGLNLQPSTTFNSQFTGGANLPPMNTFNANLTGGANSQLQPRFSNQLTGGVNVLPQNSFSNQFTGGANILPQTTFGNQFTGGANVLPQTTFGNQYTGGANVLPQTSFGGQLTGGINVQSQPNYGNQFNPTSNYQPQNSFGNQLTGNALQQTSFGTTQNTGGFQPQSSFGMTLQRTGGLSPLPQTSFNTQNGINQINTTFQNLGISQQPLQNQPTGFGFGNGPQAQEQRQANIFNASADNPFGF